MSETNWYVVTGAPSSGKTTLVRELEKLGYRVVHEVARGYIEKQIAQGRTLNEMRADAKSFENAILNAKIAIEAELPEDEVIILDRAIPDSIPYFQTAGLDTKEAIKRSPRNRYKRVLLLDRLPFQVDDARTEDGLVAAELDQGLEQSYRALGYNVIRVPAMPLLERVMFVVREIAKG